MKKYRFMKNGEAIQDGDEVLSSNGWRKTALPVGHELTGRYDNFRRPVPFTGKQAFLINYSPLLRVVIDTTGLSDGEIDDAVGLAAEKKFREGFLEYMKEFQENIDWEATRPDEACPYDPKTDSHD